MAAHAFCSAAARSRGRFVARRTLLQHSLDMTTPLRFAFAAIIFAAGLAIGASRLFDRPVGF